MQIVVAPPEDEYRRLKTFFRIILAIPVDCIQYVFSLWLFVPSRSGSAASSPAARARA